MSLEHTASTRDTGDPHDAVPKGRGRRAGAQPPASPHEPPSAGGSLTRVTANFTPRAISALERIAEKTGDSKTDVLNRSVMVFEIFLELIERGDGVVHVVHPDGTDERLRFVG